MTGFKSQMQIRRVDGTPITNEDLATITVTTTHHLSWQLCKCGQSFGYRGNSKRVKAKYERAVAHHDATCQVCVAIQAEVSK